MGQGQYPQRVYSLVESGGCEVFVRCPRMAVHGYTLRLAETFALPSRKRSGWQPVTLRWGVIRFEHERRPVRGEEPRDYPPFGDPPSDEMVWHRQVEGDLARLRRGAEPALGAVVAVLDSRGRFPLGDMLEVAQLSFEHVGWYDDFGERYPRYKARLHVPPQFVDPLDQDDVTEQIRAVLQSMTPESMSIDFAAVAPMAAGVDWRSDRALARDDDSLMANQALFPGTADLIVRDRLRFANKWEATVYAALKQRQADLPQTRTLGIMPGPGFRAPNNTFGPDFVVTYRGRAVALEVDGPHHARPKRYAADKSKDLVLESCGLVAVLRITPEEGENPERLGSFLDAVMEKLGANP